MRIVFNLHNVGLGNNGGSRTIIKCAEALQDLGNKVTLHSPICRYTWHSIGVPVSSKFPKKCDVLVATGYSSVKSTIRAKAKKKFYYVRGFERWVTNKPNLLNSYRSLRCIVNSQWMFKYLRKKKIPVDLIYPGLDFEDFYIESESRSDIIGGLFSKRHKTKRHGDVVAVADELKKKAILLNKDIQNPGVSELRQFYNKIKVWISPSELEGLHNCPMEASLCGCGLVVTDHRKGGVADYSIHNHTAFVYPSRKLTKAAEYTKQLLDNDDMRLLMNEKNREVLREKIGDRYRNMEKMSRLFRE